MKNSLKRSEVPIPEFMKSLPSTEKGYLKPWFVKDNDFRVVDGDKATLAASKQKCWICGNDFKPNEFAMVGDAVAAMVRFCKEPPCHVECATYALQVCPFLLYPNAKRRVAGLEEEQTLQHSNRESKVEITEDNPGEYFLVVVRDFTFVLADQLMYYLESNIIERQYWIGGVKQKSIPDPIIPFERLSPQLQQIYQLTNR